VPSGRRPLDDADWLEGEICLNWGLQFSVSYYDDEDDDAVVLLD